LGGARTLLAETDILVLIAELAIALIAASGIVTAIGGRGREYTPADRLRITALFASAANPLATSLFAMVLISAAVHPPTVWSLAGLASVLINIAGTLKILPKARALQRNPASAVSLLQIVLTSTLSVASSCLLLYNAVSLGAFWPVAGVCAYYILVSVWLVRNLVLVNE